MSSAALPTTRMTAEEFLEWTQRPENENRWFELVRGEVIELPAPTKIHGRICVRIAFLLESFCWKRGFGYVTGNDSGVVLTRDPDTVRGPDVALYEDATTFEELHPKYGEVPPILAVEVLSPSDRPGKVNAKIADYLNNGVKLVWLVDYEEHRVIVYRPNRNPVVVAPDGELDGGEELPGLRCPLRDFFLLPGASPPGTSGPETSQSS
jgi:Uma2 family endonuclease